MQKEPCLYLLGNFQFALGPAFRLESFRNPTPLSLNSRLTTSNPAKPNVFPSISRNRVNTPPHTGCCSGVPSSDDGRR